MSLVSKPVKPKGPPPQKPLMAWIALGLFLMSIGFAIGLFTGAILTVVPVLARPAQEARWRMSNICIVAYGMQYADRLDRAQLSIACDEMAQAYISGHPDTVNQCLSNIWDIDAAMCIEASGAPFDTAPLNRP